MLRVYICKGALGRAGCGLSLIFKPAANVTIRQWFGTWSQLDLEDLIELGRVDKATLTLSQRSIWIDDKERAIGFLSFIWRQGNNNVRVWVLGLSAGQTEDRWQLGNLLLKLTFGLGSSKLAVLAVVSYPAYTDRCSRSVSETYWSWELLRSRHRSVWS